MNAKHALGLALLALSTLDSPFSTARAQGTAFTYQGQIANNGSPANGNFDFTFALFNNSSTNTGQIGSTLTDLDVGVTNGLFTVTLDFGPVFAGNSNWLSIAVRTNGGDTFAALNPLQQLTPTPYAIYAPNAGTAASANSVAGTNIVGNITGAFTGNGAGLTNLNLTGSTGLLTANELPANVALLDASSQNFTGQNTFSGSVGIGTNTPAAPLDVKGTGIPTALIDGSSTVGTWGVLRNTSAGGTNWQLISTGSANGEGPGKLLFDCGPTPSFVNVNALTLQPNGNVGIGTTSPANNLEVAGTAQFDGNVGIGTASPASALHVAGASGITLGVNPSSGGYTALELSLSSVSNGFPQLQAIQASGSTYGNLILQPLAGNVGIGTTTPTNKLQVQGTVAVNGLLTSTGGITSTGAVKSTGALTSTGGNIDLDTTGDSSSGNVSMGDVVYSNVKLNVTSSQTFGLYVYDTNAGATTGYFVGNVGVTGTLSKGAGSFKIDHPLDPQNKWLYHSFVESPDMMNVYNGNIVTDAAGEATVSLPSYFEALNKDFRYQLTVLGQFAQAIVASEISNNAFVIKTDKPNVKVSWQVTGVRQDAYANAHRIMAEVPKVGDEIGKYIHPAEHGQPESMRMNLLKTE